MTQKETDKNVTSLWQTNITQISSNKEQIVANEALLNSLLQVGFLFLFKFNKLLYD